MVVVPDIISVILNQFVNKNADWDQHLPIHIMFSNEETNEIRNHQTKSPTDQQTRAFFNSYSNQPTENRYVDW